MLDQIVILARYDALFFAIAVARRDESRSTLAAARLRWSLTVAQQLAERAGDLGRAQIRAIGALLARFDGEQSRFPLTGDAIEVALAGWGLSPRPHATGIDATRAELHDLDLSGMALAQLDVSGASLTDINATGAVLTGARAALAQLLHCRLRSAELGGATWDGAQLDGCDLAHAALARSSWRGALASRCVLDDAHLADARLAGARFVDCSLRGADLGARPSASPARASLAGARFVRCDLRDTSWRGRDLRGASFVDCALHGAHGAPETRGVAIVRPDLSRGADGSQLGRADDVIAGWPTVIGRPRA